MYIERLTGTFLAALPTGVIIDVQGVGYGLELPLSTLCRLPTIGEKLSLWVYTLVREDSIRLFGFRSFEDRQAFEILLSLNGVGPKVALAILSTLTVTAIERAIHENDCAILESVPGVGARVAEKILVELKPKLLKLKAAHLMDLKEDYLRLEAEAFDPLLGSDQRSSQIDAVELIFSDLKSALENLGYKEKTINPMLQKLRKDHGGGADFQLLMRTALKQLSKGSVDSESSSLSRTGQGKGMGLTELT